MGRNLATKQPFTGHKRPFTGKTDEQIHTPKGHLGVKRNKLLTHSAAEFQKYYI